MDYRRPLLVFSCAVILLIATMVAGWGLPQAALTVCALSAILATFRWWVRSFLGHSAAATSLVRAFYVAILMVAGVSMVLKWLARPDLVDPLSVAALAILAVGVLRVISWWLEHE